LSPILKNLPYGYSLLDIASRYVQFLSGGSMSISIARTTRHVLGAVLLSGLVALPCYAEEPVPTPNASTQANAAQLDRDGKRICGYDLMTDSERAGHRSMLHATKSLEDRDAIRADQCKRMQQRAAEKGIKLQE
jgi:hypothetical protein